MMGVSTSLFSDLDIDLQPDAPIGSLTWYGIGGHADMLVRPHSVDALATLMRRCHRQGTPLRILGSGANLLIADEGVAGIVVRLDQPAFKDVQFNTSGETSLMKAMAGADMARTLMETVRQGLEGVAQMAGIPATIGGALRMNAGGRFGTISDHIKHISCITKHGRVVTYPAAELTFGYRESNIPDPIILSAVFEMTPADPVALRAQVKDIFAFKKSTQPLADHSAGCTFRNPFDPVSETHVPAGKLIDEAGLKGQAVGGASISRHHANFIVVEQNASAGDVIALLNDVKRRVFEHSGFELETEVVIWHRSSDEEAVQ